MIYKNNVEDRGNISVMSFDMANVSKEAAPVEPPKPTKEVVAFNRKYNNLLDTRDASQAMLAKGDLTETQAERTEVSFKKTNELIRDMELEAKEKGITLEKKPTETDAIKELKANNIQFAYSSK